MDTKHDMCPSCVQPFKEKDTVMEYYRWDKDEPEKCNGHVDCVLLLA